MGLRWILFGYEMVNDTYRIIPGEAAVVRKIFRSYADGDTLKAIADELTAKRIVYFEEKKTWNKNMVSRIIENQNYYGNEKYPAIIDRELYDKAMTKRNVLGGKREKDCQEVLFIKNHTYCGDCGSKMRRIGKYGSREKWLCVSGCKKERYVDDKLIYDSIISIINAIKINNEENHQQSDVEFNVETLKKINAVKYMENQSDIQFGPMKQALFDCVSSKFECCPMNKSAVFSNVLKKYIEEQCPLRSLDIGVVSTIIERIAIEHDGSISLTFINGQMSNSNERNNNDA